MYLKVGVAQPGYNRTHLFNWRSLGLVDLHHGAAGEFDRQMKAARDDKENRKNERDKADRVQDQRVAHKGDGATDFK